MTSHIGLRQTCRSTRRRSAVPRRVDCDVIGWPGVEALRWPVFGLFPAT
ncbi:hypothetical protein PENFLA_c046G10678 [Penicillium flavigenum]|uniref:Uncharacterized protein n=1 Tax=Penicillium flavigenum TaxID=254877 RepID=A0A1V6SHQ9_9EURO|nr:hypothetical protein PENFLA_c046G10678 [Penicillium flavigenum]